MFPSFRLEHRADAMRDIFAREWFRRMWTMQELAVAKEPLIMCGGKIIFWNDFTLGMIYSLSHGNRDDATHARYSVPCAGFFWFALFHKEFNINTWAFYRWAMEIFDAGTIQRTINRLHAIKNISFFAFGLQLVYMAGRRYIRGDWSLHDTDWDAWLLLACICHLAAILLFLDPPGQMDRQSSLLRPSIVGVINRLRFLEASDPRDKVFALYGILTALGVKLDEPDYGELMTPSIVFLNFTRRIIQWHDSLDILIEASASSLMGVPTWVPNLSKPYLRRRDVLDASAAGKSTPNFILGRRTIETVGKQLDVVDECFSSSQNLTTGTNFRTKGGRSGYTPAPAQKGDGIVLISGLRAPMLVRGECSRFEIVGVAHVDGVMQGEAWPRNSSELEQFTLV